MAPGTVGQGKENGRVDNGVGSITKTCLAGLEIPDFSALTPAARQGLDTIATEPLQGETKDKPTT